MNDSAEAMRYWSAGDDPFHPLIWIASLWAVTFPGSTWSLAVLFRRAEVS